MTGKQISFKQCIPCNWQNRKNMEHPSRYLRYDDSIRFFEDINNDSQADDINDFLILKTLINKTEEYQNTILIVKDDENNVFGAYASEAFELSGNFYGTGETFLFSFFKEDRIHVYNSTGINENYIYGDQKQLAFGCSDDYFSLTLENDLYDGYSRMTQTYKNQRLNGNKDKFIIIKLEVWTFHNN